MKNATPFPIKSKLLFGISFLLLIPGIYVGGNQKSTTARLNNTTPKIATPTEESTLSFVYQSEESSPRDTDLVGTYSLLYGKFQLKALANRLSSIPADQEIEALRMEAYALDQLYFQMTPEARKKVKRVTFPYAKLEAAGKVTYKRFEALTQKERESLGC